MNDEKTKAEEEKKTTEEDVVEDFDFDAELVSAVSPAADSKKETSSTEVKSEEPKKSVDIFADDFDIDDIELPDQSSSAALVIDDLDDDLDDLFK